MGDIITFDKKTLEELMQLAIDLRTFSDDLKNGNYEKQIGEEVALNIYEYMSEMFETCIEQYYGDYSQKYYKRTNSLYDVYDLKLDGTKVTWHFGPEHIKHSHRVSNDYIYQKMFVEGWHGGANKGPNHPSVGTPWYRSPVPFFLHKEPPGTRPYSRWSSIEGAAKSDPSPYKDIDTKIDEYQEKELPKIIEDAKELVTNRYNIFNY